jgi:hypothetical protein
MKAVYALIFLCTFSLTASAETADSMSAAAYLDGFDCIEETVAQSTMPVQSTNELNGDALLDDDSAEPLQTQAVASELENVDSIEQAAVPEPTPTQEIATETSIDHDILFGHDDRFENLADFDAGDTVMAALQPGLQPNEEDQATDLATVSGQVFDDEDQATDLTAVAGQVFDE